MTNQFGRGPLTDEVVESLCKLRDTGGYSARNTARGALIKQTYTVLLALSEGASLSELRERAVNGTLFGSGTYESRYRTWKALSYRYFQGGNESVLAGLVEGATQGAQSSAFLSLVYLHYALRDRITFDFVTTTLWERWQDKTTTVDRADVSNLLHCAADEQPQIRTWSESSRKKLAGNTLSALRDFGLLRGVQKKYIQQISVAPETVFHLVCILVAEGLRGRSILEAVDWRLFLWTETEVTAALHDLSIRRWIRFEKAGRTVILELDRQPGENA